MVKVSIWLKSNFSEILLENLEQVIHSSDSGKEKSIIKNFNDFSLPLSRRY